jgi:sulfatase modifying factor 1
MVFIEGGTYVPFMLTPNSKSGEELSFIKASVLIPSFYLDRNLVTNSDFLHFVEQSPEWRKTKVRTLFADGHYLESWKSDLTLASKKSATEPVTRVSWFAARAYCESLGKELPTTDQWEFALLDKGRAQNEVKEKILAWYGKPSSDDLPAVGTTGKNGYGISDLSSVVWEWTLDFNSLMTGDDSRADDGKNSSPLFCGAAGLGTLDSRDYATFMRYSLRSSLKASFTMRNLGFRCAKELK